MLSLDIAGVTFTVALPAPAWRPALAERYAAFPGPSRAAWQVTVTHDPGLTLDAAPWIRHDGPVTTFRVADLAGRIDLEAHRAEVRAPAAARAASALDRVISYVCMQALPREHDGLLLHAAGVALDGAGHVFTGASGAGKTTVARLAAGRGEVLTDENVIVRLESDVRLGPGLRLGLDLRLGAAGPELCSTPFWGHSTPAELIQRANRRVPLAAIYFLAHALEFRLTPLSPAAAVMALLSTEKVATERAESAAAWLAVAERLIDRTPVYRLDFRPTPELWDFLARAAPAGPRV